MRATEAMRSLQPLTSVPVSFAFDLDNAVSSGGGSGGMMYFEDDDDRYAGIGGRRPGRCDTSQSRLVVMDTDRGDFH